MSIHHLDLVIEDGEARIKFRCTGTPDASCRRRPPKWDESSDESWTDEQATETGFECWAADWVSAVGITDAIIGHPDQTLASAPVTIGYADGVEISLAADEKPLAGLEDDAIERAADWLEARRDETWNGGERRPSNYGRAAADLRKHAAEIRGRSTS